MKVVKMMQIQSPMGENHGDDSRGQGVGDILTGISLFDYMPVDCISNIISFTSPRDACVVASVSKSFELAIKSDIVWEKFLPQDYESLVPRSRLFSSKMELYFALCDDPVLIEDGKKSFWLDKGSGKRCIMLSAMNISIIWGDTPHYWQWIQIPESRFEKVAELLHVCWFEIRGRIKSCELSPDTRYSAYIIFKKVHHCYGFEDMAVEGEVGVVGQEVSRRLICFDGTSDAQQTRRTGRERRNLVKPEPREDGWMELELGEFFNEGELMSSDEIEMSALETKELKGKSGLIIHGIEIRPAKIQ